ncbi:MAG: deoxyribonuclease IV [Clostridia bacterium]|nr:deoxyribonuclease IV [Clostridia bacterium]
MFYVGCFLTKEGGYYGTARKILGMGGNTYQVFTRNPRGGGVLKAAGPEDFRKLNELTASGTVHPPLAHAPYVYNPCAKDEHIREFTRDTMREELEMLDGINGALYNFHPGNHVGQGEEAAFVFISDMLNSIMWEGMNTYVLLETMAGKGTEMGRTFEELAEIISRVRSPLRDRLGVCLDTCHIHDGGYKISEDPQGVLDEFDRVIGIERLRAIHLNDSKNPVGARKDRHEKLGDGYISLEAVKYLINCDDLEGIPFYLETPNDDEGYAREIALLKEMRTK